MFTAHDSLSSAPAPTHPLPSRPPTYQDAANHAKGVRRPINHWNERETEDDQHIYETHDDLEVPLLLGVRVAVTPVGKNIYKPRALRRLRWVQWASKVTVTATAVPAKIGHNNCKLQSSTPRRAPQTPPIHTSSQVNNNRNHNHTSQPRTRIPINAPDAPTPMGNGRQIALNSAENTPEQKYNTRKVLMPHFSSCTGHNVTCAPVTD